MSIFEYDYIVSDSFITNVSQMLIITHTLSKNVKLCKSHVKYHNCSLSGENLAQRRCIGHPKTLNYQQVNAGKSHF